jgi:hypothetical protein
MCAHECMSGEPCEQLEKCLAMSGVSSIEEVQQINEDLLSAQQDCSFCGRDKAVAGRVVEGVRGACICQRCAEMCVELFWDLEKGAEAVA